MDDLPLRATRASTAERSAVVERLGSALTQGLLDLEEYEQRAETARAVVSIGELAALTRDLPPAPDEQRRRDLQEWFAEWRWWLAGVLVLVGTWGIQSLAAGEVRTFWPGIPLGIWALVLLALTLLPQEDR